MARSSSASAPRRSADRGRPASRSSLSSLSSAATRSGATPASAKAQRPDGVEPRLRDRGGRTAPSCAPPPARAPDRPAAAATRFASCAKLPAPFRSGRCASCATASPSTLMVTAKRWLRNSVDVGVRDQRAVGRDRIAHVELPLLARARSANATTAWTRLRLRSGSPPRKPIVIGRAGSATASSRSTAALRDVERHGLRLRAGKSATVGVAIAARQIARRTDVQRQALRRRRDDRRQRSASSAEVSPSMAASRSMAAANRVSSSAASAAEQIEDARVRNDQQMVAGGRSESPENAAPADPRVRWRRLASPHRRRSRRCGPARSARLAAAEGESTRAARRAAAKSKRRAQWCALDGAVDPAQQEVVLPVRIGSAAGRWTGA